MPIYEYDCPKHGTFEKLLSRAEADKPQPCPVCNSETTRREISQSSFTLNGKWFKSCGEY